MVKYTKSLWWSNAERKLRQLYPRTFDKRKRWRV